MARQVQNRRGTTLEHSTFTGAIGEVTVDTDKDVVVVHDGATAGGVPMLKAADLAAGTGISITGTTVTNSAPDQTVALTQGANVTITGTYPNFTIASTDTNTTYTAGTGLDLTGTTFSIDATVFTTSGGTIAGDTTFGAAIIETVYALTGTTPAFDPSNGTVQTWALTGNSTPTDSLASGESLTLAITASSFLISWPTITWKTDLGAAPTLNTTGVTFVSIWKIGTTLYGARAGNA